MLKREDVYYIVVPIVTWVISLLCTYIFNNITGTKQWRLKREKSPGERYIEYFVRIIVIGALILFLNMLIEGFISSFIGTPLRVGEYIGVVIYIGLFVFLYLKRRISKNVKERGTLDCYVKYQLYFLVCSGVTQLQDILEKLYLSLFQILRDMYR